MELLLLLGLSCIAWRLLRWLGLIKPKRAQRRTSRDPEFRRRVHAQLYRAQRGHCAGCGAELPARYLEVDHIVPFSKGGRDVIGNYQLLCTPCNRTKGAKSQQQFLAVVQHRGWTVDRPPRDLPAGRRQSGGGCGCLVVLLLALLLYLLASNP